jgi:beta-glucanase (GH16 family)
VTVVWADDFDGPAGAPVDAAAWGFEVGGNGWGNEELQVYTAGTANAALDGAGCLAITARREPDGGYTSARLVTKGRMTVRHGLVTARVKVPGGRGIWPAFWMLGADIDTAGWPACGEIDVMECFGTDPRTVQGTVHGPGYAGRDGVSGRHHAAADLADDFHDYAVRWEPESVTWLFDGTPYHRVTPADLPGPWRFEHDFYLLLNVAVGGSFSVPPDATDFPRTMLVDSVTVITAQF